MAALPCSCIMRFLQKGVSLALCLACLPFQPFAFEVSIGFLIPLVWLGLVFRAA